MNRNVSLSRFPIFWAVEKDLLQGLSEEWPFFLSFRRRHGRADRDTGRSIPQRVFKSASIMKVGVGVPVGPAKSLANLARGKAIRIISARRATRRERRTYEEVTY